VAQALTEPRRMGSWWRRTARGVASVKAGPARPRQARWVVEAHTSDRWGDGKMGKRPRLVTCRSWWYPLQAAVTRNAHGHRQTLHLGPQPGRALARGLSIQRHHGSLGSGLSSLIPVPYEQGDRSDLTPAGDPYRPDAGTSPSRLDLCRI